MDRKAITTAPNKPAHNPSPSIWDVFEGDVKVWMRELKRHLKPILDWLLVMDKNGARRRTTILIAGGFLLWTTLALLWHPFGAGTDSLVMQFIQKLFEPDVLRRTLILWLALWLGVQLSAFYLDDVFELENLRAARRFIWASVFTGKFPKFTIRDGDMVEEGLNSAVSKIGGPAWVDIHLENAALFERIDGSPHVVSPANRSAVLLDGFERLRAVVDLRDQVIELTVNGLTQDGIPVTAKDVRVVYSIDRGGEEPDDVRDSKSYPFSEDALLHLVYNHGTDPLFDAMQRLINSELVKFISRHTLSEFLTNANVGESPSQFIPRDEITDQFYDYEREFSKSAEQHGVRLEWIGVGTWTTSAEIILDRHLDAWKLSAESRQRKSEPELEGTLRQSWLEEMLRLIDEVPGVYYQLVNQELTSEQILRRLVLTYREKLRNARDLYYQTGQPVPPELKIVIRHLTNLAAIYVEDSE